MKIKNPEFNKNIILPNGQNVVFSKQVESLTIYFHNIYLDPENNNEIIILYIDSNDKLTICYTGYESIIHFADEF